LRSKASVHFRPRTKCWTARRGAAPAPVCSAEISGALSALRTRTRFHIALELVKFLQRAGLRRCSFADVGKPEEESPAARPFAPRGTSPARSHGGGHPEGLHDSGHLGPRPVIRPSPPPEPGRQTPKVPEAMGNRESKSAEAHAAAQRAQHQHQREREQEARSDAQGGRWLDPDVVAAEIASGYGVRHHHESQAAQPGVKAATALHREPAARTEAERTAAARATAQGGRWLGPWETARGDPAQRDQPEVKAALAAAQDPALQVGDLRVRRASKQQQVPLGASLRGWNGLVMGGADTLGLSLPLLQDKQSKMEQARHVATGGRQ